MLLLALLRSCRRHIAPLLPILNEGQTGFPQGQALAAHETTGTVEHSEDQQQTTDDRAVVIQLGKVQTDDGEDTGAYNAAGDTGHTAESHHGNEHHGFVGLIGIWVDVIDEVRLERAADAAEECGDAEHQRPVFPDIHAHGGGTGGIYRQSQHHAAGFGHEDPLDNNDGENQKDQRVIKIPVVAHGGTEQDGAGDVLGAVSTAGQWLRIFEDDVQQLVQSHGGKGKEGDAQLLGRERDNQTTQRREKAAQNDADGDGNAGVHGDVHGKVSAEAAEGRLPHGEGVAVAGDEVIAQDLNAEIHDDDPDIDHILIGNDMGEDKQQGKHNEPDVKLAPQSAAFAAHTIEKLRNLFHYARSSTFSPPNSPWGRTINTRKKMK